MFTRYWSTHKIFVVTLLPDLIPFLICTSLQLFDLVLSHRKCTAERGTERKLLWTLVFADYGLTYLDLGRLNQVLCLEVGDVATFPIYVYKILRNRKNLTQVQYLQKIR